PIGDFRDLEYRIGFGFDALQLARTLERGDPLAQVVEWQRVLLRMTDDYKGFEGNFICHRLTRIDRDSQKSTSRKCSEKWGTHSWELWWNGNYFRCSSVTLAVTGCPSRRTFTSTTSPTLLRRRASVKS